MGQVKCRFRRACPVSAFHGRVGLRARAVAKGPACWNAKMSGKGGGHLCFRLVTRCLQHCEGCLCSVQPPVSARGWATRGSSAGSPRFQAWCAGPPAAGVGVGEERWRCLENVACVRP